MIANLPSLEWIRQRGQEREIRSCEGRNREPGSERLIEVEQDGSRLAPRDFQCLPSNFWDAIRAETDTAAADFVYAHLRPSLEFARLN